MVLEKSSIEKQNAKSLTTKFGPKERKILIQLFYRYILLDNVFSVNKLEINDDIKNLLTEKTFKNVELEISESSDILNIISQISQLMITIISELNFIIQKIQSLLSEEWKWERLPALVRAILLVGVYEIDQDHNSKPIVINELVELAKKYGLEKHYKFINALLDKII